LSITSLITNYDPVNLAQYKVTYGTGRGRNHKATMTMTLQATSRYDAIKRIKAISPMFCCVDVECLCRRMNNYEVSEKILYTL
jgi:hypothetical protein